MQQNTLLPATEKMLAMIGGGEFSSQQLLNVHENFLRGKDVPDTDKEIITSAVEKLLRVKFPKAANKVFGAKDSEAREILGKLLAEVEGKFDLSENRHKNGVKTGGNVISGQTFLYSYISYKNSEGRTAHIVLHQETIDDELKIRVFTQLVAKARTEVLDEQVYGIEELHDAKQLFIRNLGEVV